MRKKVIFCMLALIMTSAVSVNAQVIIGGNEADEPHKAAGLDLSLLGKQNLGLLLPNVSLVADAEDFVLVAGADAEQKLAATGLIVYNTDAVLGGAGIYVWTGDKWQAIALASN
jgi:hypothetical protein